MTYRADIQTRNNNARQTEQGRPDQVKNHAGGFVFQIDKWQQLERFLILGTAGGTYYASQREATKENLEPIKACLAENGTRVVDLAAEISDHGRAIKNEPAIMVLALALSDTNPETKQHAVKAVPKICRIGTHILTLADYLSALRGWGRVAQKAIREWFLSKDTEALAYQAIKYNQRGGWSMRDLLRVCHYAPRSPNRRSVIEYMLGKDTPSIDLIDAARAAKTATESEAVDLIRVHNLPREILPTELLNNPAIWGALLERMPMTALIRNLGKMSSIGVIKPMTKTAAEVASKIANEQNLAKARIHPLSLLIAYAMYKQGHGDKGSLSWAPAQEVVTALEDAYYKSFGFIEPTGKRFYIGLDVSGSMGSALSGTPITCAQGAACMASVTHSVEPFTYVAAFTSKDGGWRSAASLTPVQLGKRSLGAGITVSAFGSTDCALPMLDAMEKGIEADVFIVYTDNETWAVNVHPFRALQQYRDKTGIPAKLVVVGMTSSGFSIADPNDAGMMDVVGFDTATPQAISAFCK